MDYFSRFDNEAVSTFQQGEILTFSGGGVAELVYLRDDELLKGNLYFSMISGTAPVDNETITGGTSGTTADVDASIVPVYELPFPANAKNDFSFAINGDIRWTGLALGVSHSCQYDEEAIANFTVGETITFSGGGKGELVTLTDNGTTGQLDFRLISLPAPLDNETIIGQTTFTTAKVNGAVHERTYMPIHLHRVSGDLADDDTAIGDDLIDMLSEDVSDRSTDSIINMVGSANIDDTVALHMYGGSITQNAGDDRYSGMAFKLAVNQETTQPLLIQDDTVISAHWKDGYNPSALFGQMRFMIKTRTAGADIDGGRVKGRVLEHGDSNFTGETTLSEGEGSISLFSSQDLNNQTDKATVATWTGHVLTTGYQLIDHVNGAGARPFFQKWGKGTQTRPELYEISKYIQSRASGQTLHGRDAQLFVGADLDFAFDGGDGVGGFTEDEVVTFANGATAQLLGLNTADNVVGDMYLQLLTGVAPSDGDTITGGTSTEVATINGTVTKRTINTNFLGQFTGSAFITNNGITLDPADAVVGDKFLDLLGTVQEPPNNQSFTAYGLVAGEDYVIVATDDGAGGFVEDELSADVGNTAGNGTFVVKEVIPSDRTTSGTVRARRADGKMDRLEYSSYTDSTFTLVGTLPNTIAEDADAFITDIDKLATASQESFTVVFSTPRNMRVKARDGKATVTKTSNATGVFGASGGSATINRISDV